MLGECSHRKNDNMKIYNVQKTTTVDDVARSVPWIYAVVEN
jgi:hypothetical protein